jgi:hypothetical protein
MTARTVFVMAIGGLLLARPVQAEPVYDFVEQCRAATLGHCFHSISTRLTVLNTGPNRRICLPVSFGGMLSGGIIPVSLLEHVRLKLSAARFGDAGTDVDVVMVRVVNQIYNCDVAAKR